MDNSISYRHRPFGNQYPYTTLESQLKRFANESPDKEAFIILSETKQRESLTCKELYDKSVLFAKGLMKLGVRHGDIVGISYPNSKEWLISTFGAIISGAIVVHFEFKRFDGEDVVQSLKDLGNVVALIFNTGTNNDKFEICKKLYENTEESKIVKSKCIPSLTRIVCDISPTESPILSFCEILDTGRNELKLPSLPPDDPCLIMFTSGSSGVPKAIYRTHLSLLSEGYKLYSATGMNSNDIFVHDRVLRWTVAFPNVYLFGNVTMVVFDKMFDHPKDAMRFTVQAIEKEKCTKALLFPQCLQEYLKGGIPGCSQFPLKFVITTGLPVAGLCSQILGKMATAFIPGYGNTEIGAASCVTITDAKDYQPFCVGHCLPGIEMKVVDENGSIVPPNVTGEIYVRSEFRFLGYVNNAEKTIESYNQNGWFRMDDIGFMNESGLFFVTGRKSDVMIIGGNKVSPATTESAIMKHPDVQEVCVVPVDDNMNFQEQCACIVQRVGSDLSSKNVKEFLTNEGLQDEGIVNFSIPKYIVFFDKLPRTLQGKVDRKGIKNLALERLKHNI